MALSETESSQQTWDWKVLLGLLAVSVLGLSIRLVDIHRGLWLDELHTSWTVSDGCHNVWFRAETGNQAPVYFWFVWALVRIGGHTELMLRLISVLAGAALAIVGYRMVTVWTRSITAGILAALLIALDPTLIEYSQEARPYALLQLVAWIQVHFFLARFGDFSRFGERSNSTGKEHETPQQSPALGWKPTGAQTGFVLSAILCFYIHFTSILLTGACILSFLLWKTIFDSRWHFRDLIRLSDFAWIALGCLPLLGSVMQISERRANWELFVNDSSYSPMLLFQFWAYLLPVVIMVGAGAFTLLAKEHRPRVRLLFVLGMLYFVPVLGSWISLKAGVAALYHPRYFMIGSLGIILLGCSIFAFLFREPKRWCQYVAVATMCLMFFLSIYQNQLLSGFRHELEMPFESSWKIAARDLNERMQPEQRIYLFANLIEDQFLSSSKSPLSNFEEQQLREYCSFPLTGIYRLHQGTIQPKSTIAVPRFGKSDVEEMKSAQTVYLVIRGDQGVVSDILAEFAEFGPRNGLFIRSIGNQIYEYRGAPGHFVAVFEFQIAAESSR